MRAILPLLSLSAVAQALYFYIDATAPKCFFEELPKDTLVVGHYTAEEWDDQRQAWWKDDAISIYISVDVRTRSLLLLCPCPCWPCLASAHPSNQDSLANTSNPPLRKFSTTTIASSRNEAPRPASSRSRLQTRATTRSASLRRRRAGVRAGRVWISPTAACG